MAVELDRTWCARHGHLPFARLFFAAAAEAQCSIGTSVWRQAPPQPKLRHNLTAPVGGWIQRRRRREFRASTDGLTTHLARDVIISDQNHKYEEHFVFGTGEKGN